MKRIFKFCTAILLIMNSCTNIPDDVKYTIIKEEPNVNEVLGVNDCAIDVKLNKRVDEKVLTEIAKKIKQDKAQYKRLWIKYYLEGVEYTSIAWATTHFEPELKVEINGSTEAELKKTKDGTINVDGTIMGKWYEEGYTKSSYVLYKKNDKLFMRTIFSNGQTMDDEMSSAKLDKGTKYFCALSACSGEYYVVNEKLELEFYNKDNIMFTVAKEIK